MTPLHESIRLPSPPDCLTSRLKAPYSYHNIGTRVQHSPAQPRHSPAQFPQHSAPTSVAGHKALQRSSLQARRLACPRSSHLWQHLASGSRQAPLLQLSVAWEAILASGLTPNNNTLCINKDVLREPSAPFLGKCRNTGPPLKNVGALPTGGSPPVLFAQSLDLPLIASPPPPALGLTEPTHRKRGVSPMGPMRFPEGELI